ncbi:outer membrane protein assembly factor BamD [Pleionea sp. CnH1-48]|uniref:outer membrane protein assembly factor BamD n=1 Tax=Pleionea sp. CnH1-48 TaxID=2954494 RepID=UPI00209819EB|nr:outer membrane protein assembly factor BamD [Pleionea sp. CnH1-48]MCO7225305.1 outer membrane protein assembly factor BamD [Pleionea sp. CnH1-48]
MKNFRILFLVILALMLQACATTGNDDNDTPANDPGVSLHEKAEIAMRAGNYRSAIQYLEKLDSLYPFGPSSHKAQLSLIYSYYKIGDSALATAAADRFIRQNPNHPDVDYVYYMKGLVAFNDESGFIKELLSASLSKRDAEAARTAFKNFADLVRKHPKSRYSKDARQRMVFLRNLLAEHELHVARYYMERQAYTGAANRAQYIVENYPKTPAIPEALVIMTTAYDLLGLPELKEKARRLLLLNYPEHAKQLDI